MDFFDFTLVGLRPYNGKGGISIFFFLTGEGTKAEFTKYPLGDLILRALLPFLLEVEVALLVVGVTDKSLMPFTPSFDSSAIVSVLCNESSQVKQEDHDEPKDSYVATLTEGDDSKPERPLAVLGDVNTLP